MRPLRQRGGERGQVVGAGRYSLPALLLLLLLPRLRAAAPPQPIRRLMLPLKA